MKFVTLTETPSNNQLDVNLDNVNWMYEMSNDDGLCTKLEFDHYNVLVKQAPDEILSKANAS